jgi:two-component system invasion response regulator UvrY
MSTLRTLVLIVDDHELVGTGLKSMLQSTPDLEVAGIARSGGEALTLLSTTRCDVLLCDISLPDVSGLELLAQVRTQYPEVLVLMHSSYPESQFGLNALKSGAAGYISKSASAEELLRAIRTVSRKQRYMSPELGGLLVEGLDGRDQPQHSALSEREFNVMRRLAGGESVTEIAQALHLSVKTVSTYRTRVLEKLHLATNADLIRYCLQHGLK